MRKSRDTIQTNKEKPIDQEALRAEYAALSAFYGTVVTYRFTTLGFYLASVALILSGEPSKGKAFVLLIITFSLYLIELRNQTLYQNLATRAMQIEREGWGYTGDKAYDPFYSHMMKIKPTQEKDPNAKDPPPLDYPKTFGITIKERVSHTFALHFLYVGIGIYAIYLLIWGNL